MYGIAGILRQPQNRLPDLAARLAAMTAAMAHQEPDDKGIYLTSGGQVGLANRQLAIGDLTLAGHIPMHTEDGLVAITYNGEIDNTAALRRELKTLSDTFHSHSDTEVILPSYATWDKANISQLRGMVAFALLDQHHRSTQSDRFGHHQWSRR